MAVPAVVRWAAGSPPATVVVDMLERLVPAGRDTLSVLTFHRIAPLDAGVPPGLLSATPGGFADLLDALTKRHTVIGIDDVLRRADGGPSLAPRSVLLTVDDAYVDFADHAWPLLRERGLPVVLFVPTAYPDVPERSFWWDRLYRAVMDTTQATVEGPAGTLPLDTTAARTRAYRTLRDQLKQLPHAEMLATVDRVVAGLDVDPPPSLVLGWEALRGLAADGVALAPHSRTHPLLTRLDAGALDAEIAGSRDDLAAATGSTIAAFAYPSGAVSGPVAEATARAGARVAFATTRGVNDLRTADLWRLRRVNVSVRTPGTVIRAQVIR